MAEVVIVALAVGGVSAYVWSVIAQADANSGPSAGGPSPVDAPGTTSLPAPLRPRELWARLRTWDVRSFLRAALRQAATSAATAVVVARHGTEAVRARWARRARRSFEPNGRRIRFEDTAEPTGLAELPLGGGDPATADAWQDRPSRLLAAVELMLLVVVVGAVVAAVMFGLGEMVARAVGDGGGS